MLQYPFPSTLSRLGLFGRFHVIKKEMTITEILTRYPETLPVFQRYGLDCYDCQIAEFEQLQHGASVHKVDLDTLLAELNKNIAN